MVDALEGFFRLRLEESGLGAILMWSEGGQTLPRRWPHPYRAHLMVAIKEVTRKMLIHLKNPLSWGIGEGRSSREALRMMKGLKSVRTMLKAPIVRRRSRARNNPEGKEVRKGAPS